MSVSVARPVAPRSIPTPAAPRSRTARNARRRSARKHRRALRPPAVRETATSCPTSRNAYAETRRWLLAEHGPVCAYCEGRVASDAITLDHVTPRRGRTAYDRRDNLVLACQPCNGRKADQPVLAWLLGDRTRARGLARYGAHLSPMLVALAHDLAGLPPLAAAPVAAPEPSDPAPGPRLVARPAPWADGLDDASPYRDDPADSPYRDVA